MAKSPAGPANFPGPKKIEKSKEFEAPGQLNPPDKEAFQAYMEKPAGQQPPQAGQISPMDLAQKAGPQTAGPSLETILGKVNTSQNQMQDIQSKLQTPKLKFKHSQERLLESKLKDAKTHIRAASKELNAPLVEEKPLPAGANPVTRFLSYITDGQNQLNEAKQKISDLHKSKGPLKPTDLMLIQVKVAQAQQEIEYSSILLSKVVDALKQTLQIQL